MFEGYSTDETIRFKASSGGAITAISLYLIENGMVDGIIHTGVADGDPLGTKTCISETANEVKSHMGSRYAVSSPLTDILQILEASCKIYAFVGKPCDVAALKRYKDINPETAKKIKLTISFFCAGLPGTSINKELLTKMGGCREQLAHFQYRGNGWPGYTTAIDLDRTEHKMSYQDAWGKYLGRDVNRICRYCMDGIGEFADIACADYWYLQYNGTPDFSEYQGRNIIFCRSTSGNDIVQKTDRAGYITTKDCSSIMPEFEKYQPYQFSHRVTMKARLAVLRLFFRFSPKYDRKLLADANACSTKKKDWKIFKGTVKRILQGRL